MNFKSRVLSEQQIQRKIRSGFSYALGRREGFQIGAAVKQLKADNAAEQVRIDYYAEGRAAGGGQHQDEFDALKAEVARLKLKLERLSSQIEHIQIAFGSK
jgi:hypothetical protein